MINKKEIRRLLKIQVYCNDCSHVMSLVEAPPLHVGDGLGWGCEAFWVCLNNNCRTFSGGYKKIKESYGKTGSMRMMRLPNEDYQTVMYVGSADAYTRTISEDDVMETEDIGDRLNYGM